MTAPPVGTFGRRLRPRNRRPSPGNEEDQETTSQPTRSRPSPLTVNRVRTVSATRSRTLAPSRGRELPEWLKARRRAQNRGRLSETNDRVEDAALNEDVPLDVLENNGFSGAESTLVVFSSPPENEVPKSFSSHDSEKELEEAAVELKKEDETLTATEETNVSLAEDIAEDIAREDVIHRAEENTFVLDHLTLSSSTASTEVVTDAYEPDAVYEDYDTGEPQAEPEPSVVPKPDALPEPTTVPDLDAVPEPDAIPKYDAVPESDTVPEPEAVSDLDTASESDVASARDAEPESESQQHTERVTELRLL